MQARVPGQKTPQLMLRLKREAEDIYNNYKDTLLLDIKDHEQCIWHIHFKGAEGSVYAGELYTLQFKYTDQYPFESPEVQFIGKPPEHEHIYSCGFICLSILDSDWTPALKTSSVVLSIMSMMSSAKKKMKPVNDQESSRYMAGKSPKDIRWVFEDDKC